MSEALQGWVSATSGLSPESQSKVLASLFILLLLSALRVGIARLLGRRVQDPRLLYRSRKTLNYIIFILAFFFLGRLWLQTFQGLSTFLGFLTAGLAIALQDPIVNLVGWAFIVGRRPFEVGDRIQIGDHAGDVIDVRVFQFTLMEIGNWVDADQSTGRVIHVPNGKVFRETTANYSKGFQHIWDEIPVLLTFESNWRKAKEILGRIAAKHGEHLGAAAQLRLKKAAQKYMIFYSKLTPTVYTSVKDSGVMLTIRYLCEPRQRRMTAQQIWEDILEAFAASPDIDFAYPTQRFYNNAVEGKEGAKGPGS